MKIFQALWLVVIGCSIASCGSTAMLSKDGAAVVQAGFLSKIGSAKVTVANGKGGSITVEQTGFNGTEIGNTFLIQKGLVGLGAQSRDVSLAKEKTSAITAQGSASALVKGTRDPNLPIPTAP